MTSKNVTPFAPVYFNPNYHLPLIRMLARQGMIVKDIAEQCGLSTRDLGVWRMKFADVNEAIVQGHAGAQAHVENKMYEMALGEHTWDEVTEAVVEDDDGKKRKEKKVVRKKSLPSVKAQIFILKNIAPEQWTDKQEVKAEHELKIVWNEQREELTDDERLSIKALPRRPELKEKNE